MEPLSETSQVQPGLNVSGQKRENGAERRQEEERFNNLKKEAVDKIKSGEDAVGKKLYDAYLGSLKDPNVGDISILYINAGNSVENINNPSEANKAVVSMDVLYKRLGMKRYEIEPKEISSGNSSEERQHLLREKITQDYSGLAEKLADKFIDSYVGSLVELHGAKEDLGKKTNREELSRAEIRNASYKVEGLSKKLLHVVERGSASIGREDLGEQLREDIQFKENVTESVNLRKFNQLSEDEQAGLINASADRYKDGFSDDQDKKDLMGRMGEKRKNDTFKPIADVDQRISNLRQKLEKNLNSEPWDVCQMVSQINELQLERKALITQANVSLAEQRLDEAKSGWGKTWDEVLDSFVKGEDRGRALGNLFNVGKEWLNSHGSLLGEKLKKGVTDSVDKIDYGLKSGKDYSVEVLKDIDEAFFSEARDHTRSAKENISDFASSVRDKTLRINAETKSAIFSAESVLFEAIHETNIHWQESKVILYTKRKELGAKAIVGVTGVAAEITGRDMKAEVEARVADIEVVSAENLKAKIEEIRETNKDNPLFRVFQEDLEKRLNLIGKVQEPAVKNPEAVLKDEVQNPEVVGVREDKNPKENGSVSEATIVNLPSKARQVSEQGNKEETVTTDQIKREKVEEELLRQAETLRQEYDSVSGEIENLREQNKITPEKDHAFGTYKSIINVLFESMNSKGNIEDYSAIQGQLAVLKSNIQGIRTILNS